MLIAQGYEPDCRLTASQQAALSHFENELGFYHTEREVHAEVHWTFRGRHYAFGIEPDEVWQHRESAKLMGIPIQTLCREHLLLLLCVSGVGHGWDR